MKNNKVLLAPLLIALFCLVLNIHCGGDQKKEMTIAQNTIKPIDKFILYGVDINKTMDQTFSRIERELSSETKIDRELSLIFIRMEKDFVTKSIKTEYKDHIDIVYGPVEDTKLFERYKEIVPYSIRFYGELNVNQKPNTKNSVIEELKKNLPDNDRMREALNDIQSAFVKGDYKRDSVIKINFEMPKFPIAEFSIRYVDENKIFYEYTFSRKNEIYPS